MIGLEKMAMESHSVTQLQATVIGWLVFVLFVAATLFAARFVMRR